MNSKFDVHGIFNNILLIVGRAINQLPPFKFCDNVPSCILEKCIDKCLKTRFPKGGGRCLAKRICCCN